MMKQRRGKSNPAQASRSGLDARKKCRFCVLFEQFLSASLSADCDCWIRNSLAGSACCCLLVACMKSLTWLGRILPGSRCSPDFSRARDSVAPTLTTVTSGLPEYADGL